VPRRGDLTVVAIVFVAALSTSIPWIGTQEIWSKDEARTALIVKEMLESGDWSLPRVPGGAYGRKPPLYHWLTALIATSELDEATLRLPAAVAGAGTASLTYLFGAQLATPAVGLVAAAIFIASPSVFEWSRVGRMETLLVFCITLSLWGLGRWLLEGGRGNGLLFGVGMGLAVITKGPAGLLPLAVAGPVLIAWAPRPGRARELGLGLACAVAVPVAWLAPAALTASDFARYVGSLGPTVANELARPWSSAAEAAVGLAIGFFPWTLLLPGTVVMLARSRPIASPLVVVCLGWVVVVLVIFLVAVSPRAVYFLSAHPALALLAAWGWQNAQGRRRWWLAVPLGLGIATVIVIGIVAAVRPPVFRFHDDPLQVPASISLAAAGVLLGTGVLAWWLHRRHRSVAGLTIVAVGVVTTLLMFDVGVRTPFYNRLYPIRATVRRFAERIPAGAEVGYTEANRVTALAVRLARPMRQLAPAAITQRPPVSSPRYLLLPEVEYQTAREPWSLERVDEVVLHRVRYVLAAVDPRAGASPR
jgi:4-amino-4-deoxy-L-arabinose transferase-like glycosyltransferase